MILLAESNKFGYCPLCGNKLGDYVREEEEDNAYYLYYNCGKCEATEIEEVYSLNNIYKGSNAWKPRD